MPIYEYKCSSCELLFAKIKNLSEYLEEEICPQCKKDAVKIFSVPGLIDVH